MRQLVTLRIIDKLLPIAKKDRIELAIIGGWEVIVKKGEFCSGDTCVFFELDSFLPDTELYKFLPNKVTYKGTQGYRLKTMKLQGVLSQGLALPVGYFMDYNLRAEDLATELGIVKYDVADVISMNTNSLASGLSKGSFPSFIPKTDQERIQNVTHYFTTKKEVLFEETLKLDGSSCTIFKLPTTLTIWDKIKQFITRKRKKDYFGVCSRNLELEFNANKVSDFWKVAIKYNIESNLPANFAIQGELLAPNIQSNHEKVSDVCFYVFDVYDIANQEYLTPYARLEFMQKYLPKVKHIPITGYIWVCEDYNNLKDLLVHVDTESMNPGTVSEGRVYKSLDGKCTFKVINNRYLTDCEE